MHLKFYMLLSFYNQVNHATVQWYLIGTLRESISLRMEKETTNKVKHTLGSLAEKCWGDFSLFLRIRKIFHNLWSVLFNVGSLYLLRAGNLSQLRK